MRTIEQLAAFINDVAPRDVPGETLNAAQDCILDIVSAAVIGHSSKSAQAVRCVADKHYRNGASTLWFTRAGVATLGAAFSNSMAASAADIDDGHRLAVGHAGAAVVPAAIAIAEEVKAGPIETLTAIVLGYEAAVRLAVGRNPEMHPSTASGRWCGFGVAAAGSRLRKFTLSETIQALLITEQHSPGLLSADLHGFGGSHVKEGIAWAVVTGLTALDLAAAGFKGYMDTLDQPRLYDGATIVKNLGKDFMIDGTFFKPYACCRWIHPAIDGFLAIIEKERLSADEISAIHVETFARAVALDNRVNPETAEAAQFSLPFVLGIAALFGRDHLLPLNTELLGNASVIDFGSKVTMLVDNQIDALFPVQTAARVIVEGVGGRGRWEHFVEHPLGDPANPLGRAGLQDKFCHLTSPFFSSQNQNEMLASISTFRDGGFRELIQVLGKPLHPIESTNNISPENISE